MSEQTKLCPFCGIEAEILPSRDGVFHPSPLRSDCPLAGMVMRAEQWNTRHAPNPWRYPSRGEFCKSGFWYLVTTNNEVEIAEACGPDRWTDADGDDIAVRAWKELEEPAPKLEEEK